jgi:hypothetical protein
MVRYYNLRRGDAVIFAVVVKVVEVVEVESPTTLVVGLSVAP